LKYIDVEAASLDEAASVGDARVGHEMYKELIPQFIAAAQLKAKELEPLCYTDLGKETVSRLQSFTLESFPTLHDNPVPWSDTVDKEDISVFPKRETPAAAPPVGTPTALPAAAQ
jgi:hypothetical protein